MSSEMGNRGSVVRDGVAMVQKQHAEEDDSPHTTIELKTRDDPYGDISSIEAKDDESSRPFKRARTLTWDELAALHKEIRPFQHVVTHEYLDEEESSSDEENAKINSQEDSFEEDPSTAADSDSSYSEPGEEQEKDNADEQDAKDDPTALVTQPPKATTQVPDTVIRPSPTRVLQPPTATVPTMRALFEPPPAAPARKDPPPFRSTFTSQILPFLPSPHASHVRAPAFANPPLYSPHSGNAPSYPTPFQIGPAFVPVAKILFEGPVYISSLSYPGGWVFQQFFYPHQEYPFLVYHNPKCAYQAFIAKIKPHCRSVFRDGDVVLTVATQDVATWATDRVREYLLSLGHTSRLITFFRPESTHAVFPHVEISHVLSCAGISTSVTPYPAGAKVALSRKLKESFHNAKRRTEPSRKIKTSLYSTKKEARCSDDTSAAAKDEPTPAAPAMSKYVVKAPPGSLGIALRYVQENDSNQSGCVVKALRKGCAKTIARVVREGDRLCAVNSVDVSRMRLNQLASVLKGIGKRSLWLEFSRVSGEGSHLSGSKSELVQPQLFSSEYYPEEECETDKPSARLEREIVDLTIDVVTPAGGNDRKVPPRASRSTAASAPKSPPPSAQNDDHEQSSENCDSAGVRDGARPHARKKLALALSSKGNGTVGYINVVAPPGPLGLNLKNLRDRNGCGKVLGTVINSVKYECAASVAGVVRVGDWITKLGTSAKLVDVMHMSVYEVADLLEKLGSDCERILEFVRLGSVNLTSDAAEELEPSTTCTGPDHNRDKKLSELTGSAPGAADPPLSVKDFVELAERKTAVGGSEPPDLSSKHSEHDQNIVVQTLDETVFCVNKKSRFSVREIVQQEERKAASE